MYMQAPHDHAKWFLTKKEMLAQWNAKKKTQKAEKVKAGEKDSSTNNDAKRLKLSNPIIIGLTTVIMIGDSKAHKMAKPWFENANKRNNDYLVKD
jgi:hypothetical protein